MLLVELNEDLKRYLVAEFRRANEMIKVAPEASAKNYFFSAVYGAVFRVLNIEYSKELVLLHLVLQQTYQAVASRLTAVQQQKDFPIELPSDFFERLTAIVDELAHKIEADEDLTDGLKSMAQMDYVTTGNGYYLYQTGRFKL